MIEIAQYRGGWTLSVIPWPEYSKGVAWWRIRLERSKGVGHYWMSWNGSRFALGNEIRRAKKAFPHVIKRAEKSLSKAVPSGGVHQLAPSCTK